MALGKSPAEKIEAYVSKLSKEDALLRRIRKDPVRVEEFRGAATQNQPWRAV